MTNKPMNLSMPDSVRDAVLNGAEFVGVLFAEYEEVSHGTIVVAGTREECERKEAEVSGNWYLVFNGGQPRFAIWEGDLIRDVLAGKPVEVLA